MAGEASRGLAIRKEALRSTVLNAGGQVVALGAGFLLTPFLLHHLGPDTYGLWVLVGSLTGYGLLLDFGVAGAVTKYIAEYRVLARIGEARSLIATAVRIYTLLGLASLLLSAGIALILPIYFNIPPEEQTRAVWLVLLAGLGVGISIWCSTSTAVLRGLQRFDLVNLVWVVGSVTSVAATVAMVLAGWDVLGVAAAGIVSMLLTQVLSIRLIRRVAPELRFGWRGGSRRLARMVVSYSSWLFILDAAAYLQARSDPIVIGAFLPVGAVAPFAIAFRLSDLARLVSEQFIKILLPLASQLHAVEDRARLQALFIVSTRLTLAISLPIGLSVALLGESLLAAWVGPEYAGYGYLILVLTLARLIDVSMWPASFVLQAMSRHRRLALVAIGSGLANLVLSVVLVQRAGLLGVALGTLIPTAVECAAFVMPYTLRMIGVSLREVIMQILLPALVPVLPAALVILLLQHALQPSSLLLVGAIGCAGLLVYAIGYLGIATNEIERQTVYAVIGKLAET